MANHLRLKPKAGRNPDLAAVRPSGVRASNIHSVVDTVAYIRCCGAAFLHAKNVDVELVAINLEHLDLAEHEGKGATSSRERSLARVQRGNIARGKLQSGRRAMLACLSGARAI